MPEKEIMDLMNLIDYGWVDKNGVKHIDDFDMFSNEYILQSPEDVMKNKVGVCWDQVELERYYFKNVNNSIKTFFIVHYDDDKCPTHTFLTFAKDDMYYWFEHSWKKFNGIHKYDNLKELLVDVKSKFIQYDLNNRFIEDNLVIYEYLKPKYNISVQEFYSHCENGARIDLKYM